MNVHHLHLSYCLMEKKHAFPFGSFTVSSYISGEMVSDNIQEALATDNLLAIVLHPCGSTKTN